MSDVDSAIIPQLCDVVRHLRRSRSLLFITGAGLSSDSGLPTYRGVGGLYENRAGEEGLPIEVLLSGEMMAADPARCWRHIARIEAACRGARFNRGHEVIAEFERQFDRVWVLTQNIDGFHRQAGSRHVIEIHGDIHRLRCTQCPWTTEVADFQDLQIPPHCPECGAVVRPAVVLFGEMLPPECVQLLERELVEGFDMVFSVGTSSLFPYIVSPMAAACYGGVPTVEINPAQTPASPFASIRIPARAAAALDAIWKLWTNQPLDAVGE
ncbi:MAG: NAD-dependent deacylase [Candidatus Sumerlaeia bacterium]